jgi:predicted amidohydrolase YtcJ
MSRDVAMHADLVLQNGRILTMDTRGSRCSAIAIRDGRIVALGDDAALAAHAEAATRVIDLDGRTALPGLWDCHAHVASAVASGETSIECRDLFDPAVGSVADILARLSQAADSAAPGTWVVGLGSPLQDYRLAERRLPTRAELDATVRDRPAYVTFGAHVLVCNTRALAECGIDRHTPDPQGGTFERDPATGEPTGVVLERAQFAIKPKRDADGPDDIAGRLQLALEAAVRRGVTGIHDIVANRREILAFQLLAAESRLPVRAHLLIRVIESEFSRESLLDLGLRQGFGSDRLQIGGIKMSVDGGFTGKIGAFSDPMVVDGKPHPGLIRINREELTETVRDYHEIGMRICTHAIGDVALDMVLDAYEAALERTPRPDHRLRVEHMGNWAMTPGRIARLRRLEVLPVANPSFLHFFGEPAIDMLGERVTREGFPFRRMWDAGLPLTFGSDGPDYFPLDPLRDLGAAVSHRTRAGTAIDPGQGLTVDEGLRAQTINAARAGFVEDRLGSLEVGKLADLVVLGDDPFTFPAERFADLPVDLTILAGAVAFERPTAA